MGSRRAARTSAAHDAIAVTAAQAGRHARDALIRHALKKADVEADPANTTQGCEHTGIVLVVCREFKERHSLVPLHRRAHDLHKRQGDLRVPLLGRLEDEVVQGLADLRVLAVVLQGKQA